VLRLRVGSLTVDYPKSTYCPRCKRKKLVPRNAGGSKVEWRCVKCGYKESE